MQDQKDKRVGPRYQTRIFGVFGRDIDLDQTEMLLANMSLGGAYVRTSEPAPPGTPVTLRFYLPGDSAPISIGGEVVWAKMPGLDENPGMGVRFNQASLGDIERVKGYLAGLVELDLFGDPGQGR